jgi:hypothetical protein
MIDSLYYIFFIIIICILILVIYIKYYYHLWTNLPVNNILSLFYKNGIIQKQFEKQHKLVNHENIKMYHGRKINDLLIKNIKRMIDKSAIIGIKLYNHYDKHKHSFVSCYYKPNLLFNNTSQTYLDNPDIIASIASREIKFLSIDFTNCSIHFLDEFIYNDKEKSTYKDLYFELLKTHMQNIYITTNMIRPAVFLSTQLHPLTPLCKISIYLLTNIQSNCHNYFSYLQPPNNKWDIIEITNENFYLLKDFLNQHQNKFDILLKSNVSTLLYRIKNKDITLKILLIDGEICAFYSFAFIYDYPCTNLILNKIIYLNGSLSNTSISLFQFGLQQIFYKHTMPNDSLYIMDIADNYLLLKHLQDKCLLNSQKYFYCYNLKHNIYDSRKIFYL